MACQTSGTALRAAGQGHDSGRPPRPAQAPGGQPAGHDVRAWSLASANFDTTFAGLSLKYRGRVGLRFLKLNVSRSAVV